MKKFFTLFMLLSLPLLAQQVGDYGSNTSGNWGTAATWIVCTSAGTWVGATVPSSAPTNANTSRVWIRTGHTVSVDASGKTVLNIIVQNGAVLTTTSGGIATSPFYLRVSGTFQNDGIVGNNVTPDTTSGLGLEFSGNVVVQGSGRTVFCRARPVTNATNTTLTFATNVSFSYTGSTVWGGGAGLYTANSGNDNMTVTVNAGDTLFFPGRSNFQTAASTSNDGAASTTFNINGVVSIGYAGNVGLGVASGKTCNLNIGPSGSFICGNSMTALATSAGTININVAPGGFISTSAVSNGTLDISKATVTLDGTFDLNSTSTSTRNMGNCTIGSTGKLRLKDGTFPSGTITLSSGSIVEFYGSSLATFNTPVNFSNVLVSNTAGIALGAAINVSGVMTVNNMLQLNAGGAVTGNVSYLPTALLKYNSGGTYGRWNEWNASSGYGCPGSVQISNSTTLNYPNSSHPELSLAHNLTIDEGSALYMDYGAPANDKKLTVLGNVTINGNISMGDANGGDLYVGGDFTFASGTGNANFYPNNRAVFLNGSSQQQFIGLLSLPYLYIDNPANILLNNDITVTSELNFTNGYLYTGTNKVILGSNANLVETAGNGIYGNSTMQKSVGTSAVTFPLGVSLNAGTDDLGDVTITRVRGTGVTFSGNQGILYKWTVSSTNPPTSGRSLGLNWTSDFDNGKDTTSAIMYNSTDSGTSWNIIGLPQNCSGTRWIYNNVMSFGDFTVSDGNSPLPVELLSFTANQDGIGISLNWKTATELNNLGWDVEKLINSKWNKIGFVKGVGNSSIIQNYSFSEKNYNSGINSYRIVQIDKDGKKHASKSVEVNSVFTIENYAISNYPNPFNPSTKIRFEVPEKSIVKISIYNAVGQKLLDLVNDSYDKGIYEKTFNSSDLASGIYFYRLSAGNVNITKKMILIR